MDHLLVNSLDAATPNRKLDIVATTSRPMVFNAWDNSTPRVSADLLATWGHPASSSSIRRQSRNPGARRNRDARGGILRGANAAASAPRVLSVVIISAVIATVAATSSGEPRAARAEMAGVDVSLHAHACHERCSFLSDPWQQGSVHGAIDHGARFTGGSDGGARVGCRFSSSSHGTCSAQSCGARCRDRGPPGWR